MTRETINDHAFVQHLADGRLQAARCPDCESIFVPPRGFCPNCHASELQWKTLSGRGRLAAFTCITLGPPWMAKRGYDRDNPYCLGVVELHEGPRVVARIEGVDARQPESIKPGLSVAIQLGGADFDADGPLQLVFAPE